MTYIDIIKILTDAGVENADTDARLLLSEFCGVKAYELPFLKKKEFDSPALEKAVERRRNREPLQYILGTWYFHGLPFELNSDCLCPRADTELCVDTAISLIPADGSFIDIGTGSGAIAISVLHERKDLRAVCIDISESALEMARKNAESNGVAERCSFLVCDALNPLKLGKCGSFDAVISNPPYIPTGDLAGLAPELSYEPLRALDGGEDGMIFYRSILEARGLVRDNPLYIFEIAYDEGEKIRTLAGSAGLEAEVIPDLGGNDRVAVLRKGPSDLNT